MMIAIHMQSCRALGPPGALRPSPIDAFEQHRELCRRQRYRTTARLRPNETTTLQALGQQAQSIAVPPKQFHPVAPLAAKHEHLSGEGILGQCFLNQGSQAIEAFTQVGHPGSDPDPRARWQPNHRDNILITTRSAARSTTPRTVTRPP